MSRYVFPFGLLCAALLAACSSSEAVRDENSQFYSVAVGSTFTLNREITIQPDQTSVYLQAGEIAPNGHVDIYRPHCKFELYTISDQARTVKPDTFVVKRVVDQREYVSTQVPRYAGLGLVYGGDTGPSHLTYSTAMYLVSEKQPDVYRLDSMRWDWVVMGEFVSISEMRQALGDYFTLALAE